MRYRLVQNGHIYIYISNTMSIGLEVILFLAVYLAIAEQFIQPLGGSMGFYDG